MTNIAFDLTKSLPSAQHTDIIDVRSPSEFAVDHLPSAQNLPVLNDEERKEVGTLHKTDAFGARKRGAALIARNIARFLDGPLRTKNGSFYPFIYCWRGGLRSKSLGTILSQIGFRVSVLDGGYKRYRHHIIDYLEHLAPKLHLRILAGLTGTSKTTILHRLKMRGAQILDLEGLAHHKGSLLGSEPGRTQPTQKLFESRLVAALTKLDPSQEIWVECESKKIGSIHTPPALFGAMQKAPITEVRAPIESRVQYLLSDYSYLCTEPELLKAQIGFLAPHQRKSQIVHWQHLIEHQKWPEFVRELLEHHYDPSYARSQHRWAQYRDKIYELKDLTHPTLEQFADTLLEKAAPA